MNLSNTSQQFSSNQSTQGGPKSSSTAQAQLNNNITLNNSLNGPQSILSTGIASVGSSMPPFGSPPPSIPPTNVINNLLMDYNPNANRYLIFIK